MNICKRLIIIALSLTLTTLSFSPYKVSANTIIPAGGWQKVESPEITPELKAITDKAFSAIIGKEYIPVAYLENQVVAGMNHRILCRERDTKLGTAEVYSIVTIYEDLNAGAEVTSIESSSVATNISDLDGGWTQAESPVITEELSTMFNKPYEGLCGAYHIPIALLSTQTVNGMNYCFLVETGPVIPNPQMKMVFTTVHQDPEGNVSVIDQQPFTDDDPKPQVDEIIGKGTKVKLKAGKAVAKVKEKKKGIVTAKKSGNKVIVTGKALGTVTVSAFDKKGNLIRSWVVMVE